MLFDVGARLVDEEHWEEARQSLEESAALEPTSSNAHYLLWACRDRLGDVDGSVEEFRRCVELNPDHAYGHNFLGMVLGRQGLEDEADHYLARAAFLGNEQEKGTLSRMGMDVCRACVAPLTANQEFAKHMVIISMDFDWSSVAWKCGQCGNSYCGACLGTRIREFKRREGMVVGPKCPACKTRMSYFT
jgi:tetratricopeptide (TPR) repeat protein